MPMYDFSHYFSYNTLHAWLCNPQHASIIPNYLVSITFRTIYYEKSNIDQ